MNTITLKPLERPCEKQISAMSGTEKGRNPRRSDFRAVYLFILRTKLSMIIPRPRPLKGPCEKQISAMNEITKGRTCQTGKQKGLIIWSKERKVSHLIGILDIITHANLLTKNFKEVIQKETHSKILLSQ